MHTTEKTPGAKQPTMFVTVIDRIVWGNDDATIFLGHDESDPFCRIAVKMQQRGEVGQRWAVAGKFVTHPKYGEQFDARFAALAKPRDDEELQTFLLGIGWPWPLMRTTMETLRTVAEARSLETVAS